MKEIYAKKIHPSILNLLSFATSDFKVDQEYDTYLKSSNRKLFGFELNGTFVGCTGIEIISSNECIINHIAVSPEQRGRGIGRRMLDILSEQFSFISAETDKDAVGFYQKYGFEIISLGEKYSGVERFNCRYRNVKGY